MALFSGKTKKEDKKTEETASVSESSASLKGRSVLRGPHVTEKAAALSEKKVYTFDVAPDSNKKEVAKAVKEAYGVTPAKVRMVKVRDRVLVRRGHASRLSDGKKAYVHLKEGDSIELF